jgi:hypothetical protein
MKKRRTHRRRSSLRRIFPSRQNRQTQTQAQTPHTHTHRHPSPHPSLRGSVMPGSRTTQRPRTMRTSPPRPPNRESVNRDGQNFLSDDRPSRPPSGGHRMGGRDPVVPAIRFADDVHRPAICFHASGMMRAERKPCLSLSAPTQEGADRDRQNFL